MSQLSQESRDNLQQGKDVIDKFSQYKDAYKGAQAVQHVELQDVKQLHEDAIKDRDQAALLGKVSSAGLAVIHAMDSVANAAIASKIPVAAQLGYAFEKGMGIGNKGMEIGEKLDKAMDGRLGDAVNGKIDNAVDRMTGGSPLNPGGSGNPEGSAQRPAGESTAPKTFTDKVKTAYGISKDIVSLGSDVTGMKGDFKDADKRFKETGNVNEEEHSKEPSPMDAARGGYKAGQEFKQAMRDYNEGKGNEAFDHAVDGAKDIAKVFGKEENVTHAVEAGKALNEYVNSKDSAERVQHGLEYLGHGVGVGDGFVPGAGEASKSLLSAGQTVQDYRDYRDFDAYGRSDPVKGGVDRFQSTVDQNDAMINQLDRYALPQGPTSFDIRPR